MFGGSFGLTGDLWMPKNSLFGVQSERLITVFNVKFHKRTKVDAEALYIILKGLY